MNRYIDKDMILADMRKDLENFEINDIESLAASKIGEYFYKYIQQFPTVNIADHIKNRIYETAFNTTDPEESAAIEDIAERIDFWISELKDGDINEL